MADIHIEREHSLGLREARKIAWAWAERVEADYGMQCTYEEGEDCDTVYFSRSGVSGTLQVLGEQFELQARLGLLLRPFKRDIEAEVVRELDTLLATKPKPARKKKPAT